MGELLVDVITSLDGYASAEGWPGWWGLQGPEYLAWLGAQHEVTYLEFDADEEASVDQLIRASKVVFCASLEEPLA